MIYIGSHLISLSSNRIRLHHNRHIALCRLKRQLITYKDNNSIIILNLHLQKSQIRRFIGSSQASIKQMIQFRNRRTFISKFCNSRGRPELLKTMLLLVLTLRSASLSSKCKQMRIFMAKKIPKTTCRMSTINQ